MNKVIEEMDKLGDSVDRDNLEEQKRIIQEMERIYTEYGDAEGIAQEYARGLLNLSAAQFKVGKFKEVEVTVENVLREVYEKNPQDQEIVRLYAAGLANLSAAQFEVGKIEKAERTVQQTLKELYKENEEAQEIAREYARGLANLSVAQGLEGKFEELRETVENVLKAMYEKNPQDQEIARLYAKGLVVLFVVQVGDEKFDEAEKTIQKNLAKLYEEEKEEEDKDKDKDKDKEIARECAKGLLYICIVYVERKDYKKSRKAFEVLKNLYERTGDSFKLDDTEMLFSEIMLVEENENDANKLVDLLKMIVDFLVERLEPEASQTFRKILGQYRDSGYEERYFCLMKTYLYMSRIKDALIIRDRSRLERGNNSGSELGRYTKIRRLESVLLSKKEKDTSNKSNSSRLIGRDSYENANLRMFNASYMNDPSEGKALLEYLRKNLLQDKEGNSETKDSDANNETILDILCRQYNEELGASDIYLLSLTQAIDFLPMWSMYGEQGKGCCLVYDLNSFDYPEQNSLGLSVRDDMGMIHEGFAEYSKQNSLGLSVRDNNSALSKKIATEQKSNDNSGETNQSKALETKLPIYKVCYLSEANTDNKTNTDRSEEDSKELEAYLKGLGRSINKISLDGLDDKEKAKILALIKYILDEIRYLFKTENYSFEQEYRLIKSVPIDDAKIKLQPISDSVPQLYIELDQKMEYKEIILGPKVEDPDYIAPYINYVDRNIKVRKSKIEFR